MKTPDFTWYFLNFSIVVVGLFVLLRKPAKAFLENRHATFRDQIRGAAERLQLAQSMHQAYSENLKSLEREVAQIDAQARREAEEEMAKLLASAKRTGEHIVNDAKSGSEDFGRRLKSDLVREFGAAVLDRAEAALRGKLTGADRLRLKKQFSTAVEKSS